MKILVVVDMQKDFIVSRIYSAELNPDGQAPKIIEGIVQSTITATDGKAITVGGYLDIGLLDTMKDLFVNFIGAVVFSGIGYFYVKHRGKGKIARQFIPVVQKEEPKEDENDSEDAKDKAPV